MTSKDQAQREIRKIAYRLWMEDGQPEGRDREHWESAKAIWAFQNNEDDESDAGANAGSTRRTGKTADRAA